MVTMAATLELFTLSDAEFVGEAPLCLRASKEAIELGVSEYVVVVGKEVGTLVGDDDTVVVVIEVVVGDDLVAELGVAVELTLRTVALVTRRAMGVPFTAKHERNTWKKG